jgi:hypothetical protein
MLISLTEFKNHIGLSGTTDDTTITVYLNAISEWVKEYLGRAIEKQTDISEYFDGDNIKDAIFLNNYPVISFRWLKYKSGTNSDPLFKDFDIDDYQRDDEAGIIYVDVMYSGIRNINVVYTAGYETADIPNAIKVACMKLVAKIYNKRRSDGYSSEEISNARVEWDKFLTQDIELLLAPYKKKRI